MFSWTRDESVIPQVWHTFQSPNPQNHEMEEFIVQDLPREKFNESLSFMLEHFFADEPICKSTNIENEAAALKQICDLWKKVLNQNIVLACFKQGCDEIIGLNMVCVITKEEFKKFKLEIRKDNLWKAVHEFALTEFDLFNHYKFADKILIAYGLSVSKNYRKRGIAAEILRARIPLCKAMRIPLTSTVFTAIGSQKPAERIGFKIDFEISYEELSHFHKDFKFKNLETSSLKLMSLVIV